MGKILAAEPRAHRFRFTRPLLELLYNLRTAGDSPGRQAAAVGVGVFIGCTPFFGFHLALCVGLARLFRLNQIKTYLASHISIPVIWPFLILAEVQVGRRLRGAPFLALHLADLRRVGLRTFGLDLLAGSAVVGGVLSICFALLTYLLVCRRRRASAVESLIDETSRRYIDAGVFSWEFVRGKLRHDPVYFALLARGDLPPTGRLLDLGCGRGILLSLLATARAQAARGVYPESWPTPPPGLQLHGIEGSLKIARAARLALGEEATIEVGDLRETPLPDADAVYLLDVLHYLPAAEQERLLDRVAAAMPKGGGGLLILREADAAGGAAFVRTRLAEQFCALARGHFRQRFHFRSDAEWRRLLEERGFVVGSLPMSAGTPYANVLIEGRRAGGRRQSGR
ncbi:MAG TPA: DUF2062 domain-containing protein [Thermoanaerobaculia bacterium]|nr:DUF2062 domain-containing protein [Thermoanaerobaculia bacterium]